MKHILFASTLLAGLFFGSVSAWTAGGSQEDGGGVVEDDYGINWEKSLNASETSLSQKVSGHVTELYCDTQGDFAGNGCQKAGVQDDGQEENPNDPGTGDTGDSGSTDKPDAADNSDNADKSDAAKDSNKSDTTNNKGDDDGDEVTQPSGSLILLR